MVRARGAIWQQFIVGRPCLLAFCVFHFAGFAKEDPLDRQIGDLHIFVNLYLQVCTLPYHLYANLLYTACKML